MHFTHNHCIHVHACMCSSSDQAAVLVSRLLHHVISQPPLPPHRSQGPGLISSVTGTEHTDTPTGALTSHAHTLYLMSQFAVRRVSNLPLLYNLHLYSVCILCTGRDLPGSVIALAISLSLLKFYVCTWGQMCHIFSKQLPTTKGIRMYLLLSLSAGLWSLVTLNRGGGTSPDSTHSPLAEDSLLLLLVLTHQQARGHNPYRTALSLFSDEHGGKERSGFSVSLEKVYLTLCRCVGVDVQV